MPQDVIVAVIPDVCVAKTRPSNFESNNTGHATKIYRFAHLMPLTAKKVRIIESPTRARSKTRAALPSLAFIPDALMTCRGPGRIGTLHIPRRKATRDVPLLLGFNTASATCCHSTLITTKERDFISRTLNCLPARFSKQSEFSC